MWKTPKKRKSFSASQKNDILQSQNDKCVDCKSRFSSRLRPHFDHINGDREDNRTENGQALCANCHDQKSLGESGERVKKNRNLKDDLGFGNFDAFG